MNWEHLKTYIWVRWRLSANQIRRSGAVGAIIAAILTGLRILGGAGMFIAGLIVGHFALGQAEPNGVLYVWDGATAGFIFFWMIGLMSELQRTELLSLNNFMHLPVSPSGAFLINYVGSSISLSLILFFPAMLGLSAGLTFSRGPAMLAPFPLVVSFTLMLTAVTYQFRGWPASMMTNPRRRRTIIDCHPISGLHPGISDSQHTDQFQPRFQGEARGQTGSNKRNGATRERARRRENHAEGI